jgi:hypothetical protein
MWRGVLTYLPALAAKLCAVLFLLTVLTGCAQTNYVDLDDSDDRVLPRTVKFRLADAFYKDPPDCVVIMPLKNAPPELEVALSKALSVKIPRLIGGAERRRLTRHWAIDLTHPGDRKTFARLSKCRFALEAEGWNNSEIYVVVWSQKKIGVQATLKRLSDDLVLWRGRHVTEQSDGGLPLSPLSLATEAFSAGRFAGDTDKSASMADDLARRLFETVPDVRGLFSRKLSGKNWK